MEESLCNERFDMNRVNLAARYFFIQCGVYQLLFFDWRHAAKHFTGHGDMYMAAINPNLRAGTVDV